MAKKHRKIVKLYVQDDCSDAVFAAFTNGKARVTFPLHFEDELIRISRRGAPWQCVLANGIMQAAQKNRSLFPHPVRHVYVIGTSLYVMTHKARRFDAKNHCVRYTHNFTTRLREFDRFSKTSFAEKFGDEGVEINLRPPPRNGNGVSGSKPRSASTNKDSNKKSSRRVLEGAYRRARDAGLIMPNAAASA